jgi:hypothetical protein
VGPRHGGALLGEEATGRAIRAERGEVHGHRRALCRGMETTVVVEIRGAAAGIGAAGRGRRARLSCPRSRESAQLLQLIALGRTIAVLSESAQRHLRSDLVAVPVLDGPVATILVASPERSRAVTVFVRAASLTVGRWLDQVGSHDEWA